MNALTDQAAFALALAAEAERTHQRRDWREAAHALAKVVEARSPEADALAMYRKAVETHERKWWRESTRALARVLQPGTPEAANDPAPVETPAPAPTGWAARFAEYDAACAYRREVDAAYREGRATSRDAHAAMIRASELGTRLRADMRGAVREHVGRPYDGPSATETATAAAFRRAVESVAAVHLSAEAGVRRKDRRVMVGGRGGEVVIRAVALDGCEGETAFAQEGADFAAVTVLLSDVIAATKQFAAREPVVIENDRGRLAIRSADRERHVVIAA